MAAPRFEAASVSFTQLTVPLPMTQANRKTAMTTDYCDPATRSSEVHAGRVLQQLARIVTPMHRPLTLAVLMLLCTPGPSVRAADAVEFNRDIRPILSAKCFTCHGPDANKREAELRLDVRDSAIASAIVPSNPGESEIMTRITTDDDDIRMPPPDSRVELSRDEIRTIRTWIQQGAPYEAHWSLIPPKKSRAIDPDSSLSTAIDFFVSNRLESQSLKLAPQADRAELLRRVSLDLTGLPPTIPELDQFLNDKSPQAFERAVDRLLSSSRFGEHMARYWLDAARYADTNGYQYDLERAQWVWRDWVIHAFNSNMPFDQFTVEQLAGDLLPEATDQQKLATAFHRNHPITIEGGVIDEEYRTEYVVDRVVTTSTVWMGTTMLCSRCHDHKYDPISQREFYQMFAFFNQVPERGLNGFNPKLQIVSPLRAPAMAESDRRLVQAQSSFERFREKNQDQLRQQREMLADKIRNQWRIRVAESLKSDGGADLVVQADQSVLATGKNPATERYELTFAVKKPIRSIKLEALTHNSFVNKSTGRGSNGNFVLSEVEVFVESTTEPGKFTPAEIAAASADYSQKNYNIALAVDGKIDRSGWAVDGNTRFASSTAVFELADEVSPESSSQIRVVLHHRFGGSHHIGRFRTSFAEHTTTSVPAPIAAILTAQDDKRTAEQLLSLDEFFALRSDQPDFKTAALDLQSARSARATLEGGPATMVMAELATPRETHILGRGEYDKPGDVVHADTPAALPPFPGDSPRNRLGFAKWLVAPQHPLTSRVTVNRFWQQIFGTGIVETAEDFGSQGAWPTHPELLDWMAVDFAEHQWDVKRLLKQIVLSRTYRQSSTPSEAAVRIDPANRILSRGPRLRLDAEVIRDSALAVSGLLDERLGGPSVFPYHPKGLWQEINNRPGYSRTYQQSQGDDLYRRSLYTFWKRTVPPPSMAAFDAPEREYCVVRRSRTNTPLQAIVMMHDPQFVEAARHLGLRMKQHGGKNISEQLRYGFRVCFSRLPSSQELTVLEGLFRERRQHFSENPGAASKLLSVGDSPVPDEIDHVELAAYTSIGRILMNLSEFVTKG